MDHSDSITFALILAWVVGLVALIAQLRLFAIAATLKEIAATTKEILRDVERDLPTGDECPHCGGRMFDGKAVCRHCGRDVAPSAVTPAPEPATTATEVASQADAICPNCGYKYWYREGVRRCGCAAAASGAKV
jgi:DNA-directed RNA polymerase subunit RPC12/RpoP